MAAKKRVTTSQRAEPSATTSRKRLAGAGRREAPGTTFGSRWTDEERDELRAKLDNMPKEQAAAEFVAAHPHRTVPGAMYQIAGFAKPAKEAKPEASRATAAGETTWLNLKPQASGRMFCCACGQSYAKAETCPEGHTRRYAAD